MGEYPLMVTSVLPGEDGSTVVAGNAVRSIRSLAWKPLKMAIRIQDFGMLHVAPDLSGVIPLNAFEAQALSLIHI